MGLSESPPNGVHLSGAWVFVRSSKIETLRDFRFCSIFGVADRRFGSSRCDVLQVRLTPESSRALHLPAAGRSAANSKIAQFGFQKHGLGIGVVSVRGDLPGPQRAVKGPCSLLGPLGVKPHALVPRTCGLLDEVFAEPPTHSFSAEPRVHVKALHFADPIPPGPEPCAS